MESYIFNIQKFSIHDGPGIRTTVFFKGCPLKCQWCANPESQSFNKQITWDHKKCLHCQKCVQVCPTQSIQYIDNKIIIDHKTCIGCSTCVNECPSHALECVGKLRDIKNVVDICLQDKDFYEESDGGVTLSGGEVLAHKDYAISLMKELKKHHIHIALETTGYAQTDTFDEVIQYADLLLFDMKHYDKNKHIEGTGVDNTIILENMKRALKTKDILPRIPVIPGYNDSLEDAYSFSKLLKEIGIHKAQLLPFHQFGENKYDLLHQDYAYKHIPSLHKEDLGDYLQVFIKEGVQAYV